MNTQFWGSGGWVFLHTITFNYPEVYNEKNAEHRERRKYTKQLFENLQYTLPCKYCRASFQKFLKKLPIDGNLKSRADLTFWLYQIHNMVNAKLRKQEEQAVQAKYDQLVNEVETHKKDKKVALSELEEFVVKTMITADDPSFEEICTKYEMQRAGCAKPKNSTVMASCRTIISSAEKN